MTATLFEMSSADPSGALVAAYRAELERGINEATRACEKCSPEIADRDRLVDMIRGLAEDGDTSWARSEILECIDLDCFGSGRILDSMLDHINCIGLAFWRLYRAERGVTGKGGLMNYRPTPETDAAEMTASTIAVNLPPASARFVHAEFARKLERERNEEREKLAAALVRAENAEQDRVQADTDSIRALHERNGLREQLAAERALADRLAGALENAPWPYVGCEKEFGEVWSALTAWEEARKS